MNPKNKPEWEDKLYTISIANLLKRDVTPEQREIDEDDLPKDIQDAIKTVEDVLKDL
jgi:hypothetical protein